MEQTRFQKICTSLCAVAITFMVSTFISSHEVSAATEDVKVFKDTCVRCGNVPGTYMWWTDAKGNPMTTFFPQGGGPSLDVDGHVTFLTDTTKKDSLAPIDIIIRAGYDELLFETNQLVNSQVIDNQTGEIVGNATINGTGTISTGNLQKGTYSILSIGNTGEAASTTFIKTPNNEIMLGK